MQNCAGMEQNKYGIWECYDQNRLQTRMEEIRMQLEKPLSWIGLMVVVAACVIGGFMIVVLILQFVFEIYENVKKRP